ncbi:MAG: GDP-L-fucose synthase [Chitinophagaceae bacterium]|nr:MAG: GDP-L-fucose synthase [Chitinophagaceae bacterium]
MNKDSKIYIAGHRGMVGSAIFRKLTAEGYTNIITKTSAELDLRNQQAVTFIYDNLMMESNIIHQSYVNGVKKLLFLGSSCIYPKMAPQPLKEEYLLSGYLEETNKSYAVAKIAGIKLCESYREEYGCNFISAMPTNLYGPNDNYDLEKGHVLAALMRKFITAKKNNNPTVTIWGTGKPRREFLHVDDLAEACMYLMQHYNEKGLVNIGTGTDVTILELAQLVQKITGYEGSIIFDESKPDGVPRKLLDVNKINKMGWKSKIQLNYGLELTFEEVKSLF